MADAGLVAACNDLPHLGMVKVQTPCPAFAGVCGVGPQGVCVCVCVCVCGSEIISKGFFSLARDTRNFGGLFIFFLKSLYLLMFPYCWLVTQIERFEAK